MEGCKQVDCTPSLVATPMVGYMLLGNDRSWLFWQGVMKIGIIAPKARVEHTSLTFWDSVLAIALAKLPEVTTKPVYPCLCSSMPERSVQTTTVIPSGIVSL